MPALSLLTRGMLPTETSSTIVTNKPSVVQMPPINLAPQPQPPAVLKPVVKTGDTPTVVVKTPPIK